MPISEKTLFVLKETLQKNPNKNMILNFLKNMEEDEVIDLFKALTSIRESGIEQIADRKMMTVEETAELFGVTNQAVYKWIKKEKIKYVNTSPVEGGRGYLIPKDQFENKLLFN
ncbi:helix-turn-helix domain-containing protein (plasmid) [Arthrobacter citreus]|nr:helix-turn-helix domain-containing protein [Arthrobacter citreus]